MSTLSTRSPFASTVGRKFVVALSGVFLLLFLVVHLSGNLLLFANDGGEAFNAYAHFMGSNPIIRILEIGLFLGFLVHIVWTIRVSLLNRKARPVRYKAGPKGANSSWYSRYMIITGLLLLFFLILHLLNFWVEARFMGEEDMFHEVQEHLSEPLLGGYYMLAMVVLLFHLIHGFQSAFQTLGLQINTGTGRVIKAIGVVYSVLIATGFLAMPLYFLLKSNA